jgi:hypothetical protein
MADRPRGTANEAIQVEGDAANSQDLPPDRPQGKSKRPSARQQELTKVSANLVSRSIAALEVASKITGDNQTDVVNRSVQLYAYIVKLLEEGKLIFIEDPATGSKERLVLL